MGKGNSGFFANLVRAILVLLFAAAIYQEMSKPPEERRWHGKVANLVPYDFRFPTKERIRQRLWNPDDERIFTEHVFGVGWAINFYALLDRLDMLGDESKSQQSPESPEDMPDQIP